MENILKKLLQSDNALIKEGTKELREALKSEEAVGALCEVLSCSQEAQLRQYAAVVLHKRLGKSKHWAALHQQAKNHVKNLLMERLVNEQEKSVKNSVVTAMGTIVKHELPSTSWPELFQFIQHTTTSSNINDQELGFYTLNILLEVAPAQFFPHVGSFIVLFSNTLNNLTDLASPISYFIVLCMMHFSPPVRTSKELSSMYVEMLPKVIACLKALATKRPDRACEALDFFYDLAEPSTITAVGENGGGEGGTMSQGQNSIIHQPKVIKLAVKMSLDFVQDKNIPEDLRMKSLNFICTLVGLKIKYLEKKELMGPILATLFKVMSLPLEVETDVEEYFASDSDEDTMLTCASETLDTMALNMKAQTLIPLLLEHVEPALIGRDPYAKRAGYLSLGILAQGCDVYLKTVLDRIVGVVHKGVLEPQPVIRNAALFALGQFAEHLQPEISQFASELMPVVVGLVGEIVNSGTTTNAKAANSGSHGVDRVLYAVEKFAEAMEEAFLPYTPQLVAHLLSLTSARYPLHTRELAITTIASIAGAIKEGILPYFQEIMSKLDGFLTQEFDTEIVCLQVEAIDTLGILARSLGEDNFRPFAGGSIDLGLRLLTTTEDPDIRKSVYGLLGSVSIVTKEEMAPVLPTVMGYIIKSIKSDDGFINHYKEDEEDAFPVYDSESDEEEDENDGAEKDDYSSFGVENDFVEEKEESCFAIKELAANTGAAFAPYLQSSFEEVFKLMNFPNEDVRRAAIEAEFQILQSIFKMDTSEGQQVSSELAEKLVSKAALLVRVDEDKDVVLSVLECFQEALKELKGRLLASPSVKEAIINCIKDVLTSRTEAQGWGESGEPDEEDEELLEAAGFLVPAIGKAMSQQEFASHFSVLLPLFKDRLYNVGEGEEDARANTVGMLAECMEGLGPGVAPHAQALLPFLLCLTADPSNNVRNNAIFAIGEMAYHAKHVLFPYYTEILNALSKAIPGEKDGKVLDNICGAVARLILANTQGVPIPQVLPVLVGAMPLREDFEENKWIFGSFTHLYSLGDQTLVQHLVQVVRIVAIALQDPNTDKDTRELITNLSKMVRRDFPNDWQQGLTSLPPEAARLMEEVAAAS